VLISSREATRFYFMFKFVKKITRRVISDIFQENSQIENAAKVNQLLQTWLKAHEMEELSDLETRLAELQKERRML
jgi:hypothetical protein